MNKSRLPNPLDPLTADVVRCSLPRNRRGRGYSLASQQRGLCEVDERPPVLAQQHCDIATIFGSHADEVDHNPVFGEGDVSFISHGGQIRIYCNNSDFPPLLLDSSHVSSKE